MINFNLLLDALTVTCVSIPQNVQSEEDFISLVSSNLGGSIFQTAKGQNGYPMMKMLKIERPDREDTNIRFRYGSTREGMHMSIATSGTDTVLLKDFLAKYNITYVITRADIAADFLGSFEKIYRACSNFRKRRGLKSQLAGDWEDGKAGRTFYMGSRSSESFMRLYEKGKELQLKGYGAPDDLLRLELEFKPQKLKRKMITDFDLMDILTSSPVAADLFTLVFKQPIKSGKFDYTRDDDSFKTLDHMINQYEHYILDVAARIGRDKFVEYIFMQININQANKYGFDQNDHFVHLVNLLRATPRPNN